jgi:hypothetical protein
MYNILKYSRNGNGGIKKNDGGDDILQELL